MTAREFVAHIYEPGVVKARVEDERTGRRYNTWVERLAIDDELRHRNVKWWKYEGDEFTVVLD